MGKPTWSHVQVPAPEYIGCVEGTSGSETSQYRQEEIFREEWRAKADQAKPMACDTRQGLRHRGCGTFWIILPDGQGVRKLRYSRRPWEGPAQRVIPP